MGRTILMFTMGAFILTALSSDEHEWGRDCEGFIAVMLDNYQSIKLRKDEYTNKGINFLKHHREVVENDLETTFVHCKATPERAGFSKEEFLEEFDALLRSANI